MLITRFKRKIRKKILFERLEKLIPTTEELNEQKIKDKNKLLLLEKAKSSK